MDNITVLHTLVAAGYLTAALLLLRRQRPTLAMTLLMLSIASHLGVLMLRWWQGQQLPIVTRYEDITVDALVIALLYLVLQWRRPTLRHSGALALVVAGLATLAALGYSRGHFPWSPALRSHWLLFHAQLNSLAIALGSITASVTLLGGAKDQPMIRRLLLWTLLLWGAMVGSGAAWASVAWGRYWAWDPIESWALVTLLAYAWVLHWPPPQDRAHAAYRPYPGLIAYGLMLFTTYGLLLLRYSLHSQYLFQ